MPPPSKKVKVGAGSLFALVKLFGVMSVDVPAGATAAMAMTAGFPDTSAKKQRQPFKFPHGLICLTTVKEHKELAGIRKKNTDDDKQMSNKKNQLCF